MSDPSGNLAKGKVTKCRKDTETVMILRVTPLLVKNVDGEDIMWWQVLKDEGHRLHV